GAVARGDRLVGGLVAVGGGAPELEVHLHRRAGGVQGAVQARRAPVDVRRREGPYVLGLVRVRQQLVRRRVGEREEERRADGARRRGLAVGRERVGRVRRGDR